MSCLVRQHTESLRRRMLTYAGVCQHTCHSRAAMSCLVRQPATLRESKRALLNASAVVLPEVLRYYILGIKVLHGMHKGPYPMPVLPEVGSTRVVLPAAINRFSLLYLNKSSSTSLICQRWARLELPCLQQSVRFS